MAVETVSGGVVSGRTNFLLKANAGYPYGKATACGGGEVTAAISNLTADSNETAQVYQMTNLDAGTGSAPKDHSSIGGQGPFHYDTSIPYTLDIELGAPLAVGQTYSLNVSGPPNTITYGDSSGAWRGTGTLAVLSVANHTMTFHLHARMVSLATIPVDNPEGPPLPPLSNPAKGSFDLDLSGTVGVAGL